LGIAGSLAIAVAERYRVNPSTDPLKNPQNRAPTLRGMESSALVHPLALPDTSE
jgi:hypothetical protein